MTSRFRTFVGLAAASALLVPGLTSGPASASASPHPTTLRAAVAADSVEATARKPKRPKGMSDKRLRILIERSFRGIYSAVRECDTQPDCTVTFKWSRIQWRGSARHCIAGQNYGKCERWATAFVARTDLLLTETENPDWEGKLNIYKRQFGYWSNGLKRVTYTDDYGTREAVCESVSGCGKSLLVWQDEFKDWFYSFSDIGDCCSAVRLT
ncbi:MAG: hypothetical protein ACO4CO_03090 [Candidatus Nanopelagicales bacterium]